MSKKVDIKSINIKKIKKEWLYHYNHKYMELFYNKFKFSGDIDYQEIEFILDKLWYEGKIIAFKMAIEGVDKVGYAPFSVQYYNYLNYPCKVRAINIRGFNFIPNKTLIVDKDCTLCYLLKSHESIYSIIQPIIKRIVDIEMVTNTNLISHKLPRFVGVDPADKNKALMMVNKILSDEPIIFEDFNALETLQEFVNGSPYIVDKLYSHKKDLEDEILTILGINNVGKVEKEERVNTIEASSNEEEIALNNDRMLKSLNEFFERVNTLFGVSIKVENAYEQEQIHEENEKENEEDEE